MANSYYLDELEEMPSRTPIANGNLQARCRMMYLYDIASRHKGLVMSTDNQTEYQLGFWTIHGDVGDFGPIQDLWKTEVYELAKWLVTHYQDIAKFSHLECWENRAWKAIVESIKLTPTDGLGISNSDLDQIGAKSYDEVDDILRTLIPMRGISLQLRSTYLQSLEHSREWISLSDKYGEQVVTSVYSRYLNSKFKRNLPVNIHVHHG